MKAAGKRASSKANRKLIGPGANQKSVQAPSRGSARIGPTGDSAWACHEDILQGLPIRDVVELAKGLQIHPEDMARRVGLSRSTFHRNRNKRGHRLDQLASDALARHCMLLLKATEVFEGDVEAARQWLTTEQMGLGGKVPLDLVRTSIGAREVEKLLTRIDRGVYA